MCVTSPRLREDLFTTAAIVEIIVSNVHFVEVAFSKKPPKGLAVNRWNWGIEWFVME